MSAENEGGLPEGLCPPSVSRRALLVFLSVSVVMPGMLTVARSASTTLKANYFDDFAPFSFLRDDGTVAGILVDALDEVLTHRCGIALVHRAVPWARAQMEVREGSADVFCTLATDERRTYATFSQEALLSANRVVVYAKNNPRADAIRQIKTAEDMQPFFATTYIGDSQIDTLFKDMNVEVMPDTQRMLMKIAAGRSDITVMPSPVWKYHARALGLRERLDEVMFSEQPGLRLGIRTSHPMAVEILDRFDDAVVEARKDGTLERIVESYG